VTLTPATPDEVRQAVAGHARVRAHGARSKPPLAAVPPTTTLLDLRGLAGIVEYDPGEYTVSVLAGTRIAAMEGALADRGQRLPFDPPLAGRGATIGGTVAAGLSGPGRYGSGGVRDFVLGVRFVDGGGRLVRGGGKVVKNAAGFDLPKLLVGSLGRLGVIVELTFKVFPAHERYGTLRCEATDLAGAVALARRLARSPWDLAAVEIVVSGGRPSLIIRMAGLAAALTDRLERLRREIGHGDVLTDGDDDRLWSEGREFSWVEPGTLLVKVPMTPGRVVDADARLAPSCASRRYGAGGQVAWLAWRDSLDSLDTGLGALGLGGLVILGETGGRTPLLGVADGGPFAMRVKSALDPANRFGELA
jgi:glycolate oxidase FAD binding subunit